MFSREHLDLRAEQLAAAADSHDDQPGRDLVRLRSERSAAKARLNRVYELMEDPDYPPDRAKAKLAEHRAAIASLDSEIATLTTSAGTDWTAGDYRAALASFGGIGNIIAAAEPSERRDIYRLMGLSLTYRKTDTGTGLLTGVVAPPVPRGVMLRVGGGT